MFAHKMQRGLTLIELLVVISILGILIGILFAVLDPLQQTKKATDSVARNTATEFLQGALRYNTEFDLFPWTDGSCSTTYPVSLYNINSTCTQKLISSGELKNSFSSIDPSVLQNIYISTPNPVTGKANSMVICYFPISKQGQQDPLAIYTQGGQVVPNGGVAGYDAKQNPVSSGSCLSKGGANYCYVCFY